MGKDGKEKKKAVVVQRARTRCSCGSDDIVCNGGVRTRPGGRTLRYCHCRTCGRSVIEIID